MSRYIIYKKKKIKLIYNIKKKKGTSAKKKKKKYIYQPKTSKLSNQIKN